MLTIVTPMSSSMTDFGSFSVLISYLVAGIKKKLREKGVYFSSQIQVTAHHRREVNGKASMAKNINQ